MELSISNIAWDKEWDASVYQRMQMCGYGGLEIAPTRIFPEKPYENCKEATSWAKQLKEEYGFKVPSMQSIWFGRNEKLFGTKEERNALLEYTKQAILFASAIGCDNLVFGCPRNRYLLEGADETTGIAFFKEIGEYALSHGTTIGMEANPPIYNTNYINDTCLALELIKQVDSKGFLLNLDMGTMIENQESIEVLKGNVHLINHIHISEPGLKPIQERKLHQELKEVLVEEGYKKYVSIEMGKVEEMSVLDECMSYVKRIFG